MSPSYMIENFGFELQLLLQLLLLRLFDVSGVIHERHPLDSYVRNRDCVSSNSIDTKDVGWVDWVLQD